MYKPIYIGISHRSIDFVDTATKNGFTLKVIKNLVKGGIYSDGYNLTIAKRKPLVAISEWIGQYPEPSELKRAIKQYFAIFKEIDRKAKNI
jgi:hypothetical protein